MNEDPPCQLLTWDSDFFGFPIARVRDQTLTPQRCEQIDAWANANGVRCLYFQASSEDGPTQRLAALHGFFVVDVRMTFEWSAETRARMPAPSVIVRAATPQDLAALEAIAAESHRQTRFSLDGGFPRAKCDELYAIWVRRCCNDPQCAVWVAETDGRLSGYVTCEPQAGTSGRIGLIAVEEAARGRGVGAHLVHAAQDWFAARQLNVSVATQGHNIAAQRLYQRCGFLTSSVHLYYHKWYAR